MKEIFAVILALAFAAPAAAIPISGLTNTGLAADGTPLSAGEADPSWFNLDTGAAAVSLRDALPSSYAPHSADSRWVWETENGTPVGTVPNPVFRDWAISFDMTGRSLTGAFIRGQWQVDNEGFDILLNGVSLGPRPLVGFGGFVDFEVTDGFQDGLNTLSFKTRDFGVIAGFRVEFTESFAALAPIPLPAALPLSLVALASIGGLSLRRRKQVAS